MRIGHGYDVHQLIEGRKLILGGVDIPHRKGLLGHSDADVLIHALIDALLGAAGKGDIGHYFPDKDPKYEGANSRGLLKNVMNLLSDYAVGNVDVTVMAQHPKLAPHLDQMKVNIANDLGVSLSQINIKATTTENLGFVGREEGIAASAVALLENKTP
jgi:2-C-methyl-D-erythritol 2,4-cyclodiphosphate synthase